MILCNVCRWNLTICSWFPFQNLIQYEKTSKWTNQETEAIFFEEGIDLPQSKRRNLCGFKTSDEAEKHPKADKLLVFQVKMGTDLRQVISGVAEHFKPEEMVGKEVIVVANLKPRKLRGEESKGMILFADNGEKLEIVTTEAEDGNAVS